MKVASQPLEVEPFRIDDPARDDPGDDPIGDAPAEALIREAKQRARRRRLLYGGAAVLVAIAAVAALVTFRSEPPPPQNTAATVAPRPAVPLGAPLVVGPDAASTLLASYGQIHFGYVLVYADGRVLLMPDIGSRPLRDFGQFAYDGVIERRLSPHGLELVRGGQVAPREFLVWSPSTPSPSGRPDPWAYSHEELWAEPTARSYEPSAYAICYYTPPSFPPTHAVAVASLPPVVQPLLDGKLHTYNPRIAFTNPEMDIFTRSSDGAPLPPMDCFELTTAETAALYRILDANGWIPHPPAPDQPQNGDSGWYGWAGGAVHALEIYPHGQPVLWGG